MTQTDQTSHARLFVVSGPSGSGKTSLCRIVAKRCPDLYLSVSATTRGPGRNEVAGRDYLFLDHEEFHRRIKNNEFLEYAQVFDNYYGTPAGPVQRELDAGRNVILEIDIQGAIQVFAARPDAVGILVLPPSDEELARRLRERRRDDDKTIAKRLAKANTEIRLAQEAGRYQHTIINQNLDQAADELQRLVASDRRQCPAGKTC